MRLLRIDGFIDVEMPDKTVTGIVIRLLVE
jgi:hypothetical protein